MTKDQYNQDDEQISAQPGNETSELLANSGAEDNTVPGPKGTDTARKRSNRTRPGSGRSQTAPRRKRNGGGVPPTEHTDTEGIIELPVRQRVRRTQPQPAEEAAASEPMLFELEAQGFTEDEAYHLIHVSDRIANSREMREAEAVIRRLRFNRWLFEQGKLSEFSA